MAAIVTDSLFACTAHTADQLLAKYVRVWAYEYKDTNAPELFNLPTVFSYGATHRQRAPISLRSQRVLSEHRLSGPDRSVPAEPGGGTPIAGNDPLLDEFCRKARPQPSRSGT